MPDWHRQEDEAYRAIGRYVATFSILIATMREGIVTAITGSDHQRNELAQLALGSQTAQQVADAFFAICRSAYVLDDGEQRIEKRLRLQVDDEIRRRNRIAHGDWFVLIPSPDEPDDQVATLERVKASRRQPFIAEGLTVDKIMGYVGSAWLLEQIISIFALSCLGGQKERVSTVLEIDPGDGRVINNQAFVRRVAHERGY